MRREAIEHLSRLFDQHGALPLDLIIRDARRKASPLHDEFEWDPRKAHPLYLRERARYLIRQWYVEREGAGGKLLRVRGMVSLPEAVAEDELPRRAYYRMDDALRRPHLMERMLDQALAELQSFQRKYRTLSELSEVFDAIDRLSVRKSRSRSAAVASQPTV